MSIFSYVKRFTELPVLSALMALPMMSCAAPPLSIYVLQSTEFVSSVTPLPPDADVIQIAHVVLPDYLDTQDIWVRRGDALERSDRGRWASRLSAGIEALLIDRLSKQRPDAFVTGEPQSELSAYRISIKISRLDITTAGIAILDADWSVVPRDQNTQTIRHRVRINGKGNVENDSSVAALITMLIGKLADAIDIKSLN